MADYYQSKYPISGREGWDGMGRDGTGRGTRRNGTGRDRTGRDDPALIIKLLIKSEKRGAAPPGSDWYA